jgi:hypothetical protein
MKSHNTGSGPYYYEVQQVVLGGAVAYRYQVRRDGALVAEGTVPEERLAHEAVRIFFLGE